MRKAATQQNSSQFITISDNFAVELTAQPLVPGVSLPKPLNLSGTIVNNKGLISKKPLMMSGLRLCPSSKGIGFASHFTLQDGLALQSPVANWIE